MDWRTLSALFLLSLATGGCAQDLASRRAPSTSWLSPTMPQGTPVPPPPGYAQMCARSPALCTRTGAVSAPAASRDQAAADGRMRLLMAVNRRVNTRTRQMSDDLAYGQREVGRPAGDGPAAVGDCEDIAIEKRLELARLGVPDRELYYAVGYIRGVGLHTVLVARSAEGDVVLDSRTPYLERWQTAPYGWVMRQSQADPAVWTTVSGWSVPLPTITAALAGASLAPGGRGG